MLDISKVTLLNNAAATGPVMEWSGGTGVFAACGTFGGATVSLQFLGPDGATMITMGSGTTLTANGAGVFNMPRGSIQVLVSGGTPTGLYASAARLGG